MKFQKLTIHNIASIEDAVIDFEAQPLADSEVFLITGKTGSGKSTILDAICLALYADTPRLDSTRMQGDTKDGEKSVKIDDPRQLMRRNTGEAFVSLTFMGSNGVHYEATWAVTRARKKLAGNIQPKNWMLKNLDTDHTLTKDKEIEAEIHAAIGLDFSQFCRTTMLAQGEFTRFLNSKDDEKAEILEKITGVDVYSKIGAKVFEVTGQKKLLWDEAQRLVAGTRTLTDEEIAKRQELLTALDNQHKDIKVVSDRYVAICDWMKKDTELTLGKDHAADALRIANDAVKSDDFRKKEQNVKNWNATIEARSWMTEAMKASNTQREQRMALEILADTYAVLLGGQKYAEDEVRRIDAEIRDIEAFLLAEADKVGVYENAQTIVGYLNTIDEGRKAIQKSQAAVESENRKLTAELMPVFEKATREALDAKTAFETEETSVRTQEEYVANLNLSELRAKRDAAKDLLGKIATARERIDMLSSARSQYEETRKILADRKTALDEKSDKAAAMDAPIHDAKIKMDVRKEDLDRQRDTIDKFASTLRLKLQVGDICPVCRQEIRSALPHEDELAALVGDLSRAYDEAVKEHDDLVKVKVNIDAEIKTESKVYEHNLKVFNEDKSVVNAEQKAWAASKACGIENLDDTTLSALSALEVSTSRDLLECDVVIKDGEKQEAAAKNLRKALESKRKCIEALAAKVIEAEKALNECKGRISTAEALGKSKSGEVDDALRKASELIVGNWSSDWRVSPSDFASSLIALTKAYNGKVLKKQTLTGKLETSKTNVENVRNVLTTILSAMPAWKEVGPSSVSRTDNLPAKANMLNSSVAAALSKLKMAEDSLDVNQTKLNGFFAEHPELNIEHLEALNAYSSEYMSHENDSLKAAREAVVAKKTLFENAERLLNEHLTRKPEIAEDETIDTLTERIQGIEGQLAEIGERKGAINQELKTDKENREQLQSLIEDAGKKKADYQKWSRINQLIGDSTGKRFRMIAQSYVLTSLIHSANSYMKTLTDRYMLKVMPGTFVISLVDAYQGSACRAASTISGGESFLVSLSLALALSDIGQTLSVDTLFIDEGFGTLSGEPLQNAITTLRSLHTKAGRHVGIISHVEELQERISVQIQVNQEGNNSSSKVNIISK